MKKTNLFLSLVFICCAVLVACGSVFGTIAQVNTLNVQAAEDKAVDLFKKNGSYAVERKDLEKGAKFNFFGYTWRVVYRNDEENVVTFWMDKPMEKYAFNPVTNSNADMDFEKGTNVWSNGYTKTTLNGVAYEESAIRTHLRDVAKNMIDNKAYKAYANKVVKGYVKGSNMTQDTAKQTIAKVAFAKSSTDQLQELTAEENALVSMVANYDLTDDRLWLPAVEEIRENGLWRLSPDDRNWKDTTIAEVAWLRTPNTEYSYKGALVGFDSVIDGVEQYQSFYSADIDQLMGVRPAIHLNLSSIEKDGKNNGGWFTDDMMKVFFIIICVVGVIGIILVIAAVIIKARQRKKEEQQA